MLKILYPLAWPTLVAAAGTFASYVTAKHFIKYRGSVLYLRSLIAIAVLAAWLTNAGQTLYDFGLSFPMIDAAQLASYFIFAFVMFGAWRVSPKGWWRSLLLLLVPVAFLQPLLRTWALFTWTVYGFAP